MMASDPDIAVTGYRSGIEKRAKAYLKKKRREATAKGDGKHGSIKVRGPRDVTEFKMNNQEHEQINYSNSQFQEKKIYHGPIFKNSSFGSNSIFNVLSPDLSEKSIASVPQLSRKRSFHGEVPGRKRKFKTAKELGLSLK